MGSNSYKSGYYSCVTRATKFVRAKQAYSVGVQCLHIKFNGENV